MSKFPPICPYCKKPGQIIDSARIYNGVSYGLVWACPDYPACDSYVGCHAGTHEPLGRMANGKLRAAKKRAHASFDPLWKDAHLMYDDLPPGGSRAYEKMRKRAIKRIQQRARNRAYKWLAKQIGIPEKESHIGWFDLDLCEQTVHVCQGIEPEDVRAWAKAQDEESTHNQTTGDHHGSNSTVL